MTQRNCPNVLPGAECVDPDCTHEDPRKAETLGEAGQNPDGTFDACKTLSWLTGLPLGEVRGIANDVLAKRKRE